ncbi:MAG TPA: putative cytokinetic ring protein SteA [Gaiellaceae bacterium]|jgi:uncharacterized membrane-anchored protein|nr:putative cytokinetic ring protein SteA [Gaiellaceae bacterium]
MSFVEFRGTAKLDRRTKNLVKRLGPDDIAIVDHADLDRISAEELLDSGVRVVFNVSESVTGRFPNPGPLTLVRGGVRLIDAPGAELFDEVKEGEPLVVRGGDLFRNGTRIAAGRTLAARDLEEALTVQRSRVAEALEDFADNTMRFLREEGRLLAEGVELPQLRTRFRDRHAVVAARAPEAVDDLRIVRTYIRDFKPVLVGVDGGADRLIEAGYRPDVVVGDMDSISDGALRSGAELVVHAYTSGDAPGRERLERMGLQYSVLAAPGLSEDVAMLLAFDKGAALIVAVGTHFNLLEFLERNRAGMSSTFVTRLKVGDILVDARGVSRLFRSRVGVGPFVALAFAGLAAVTTAIAASPELRHFFSLLAQRLRSLLGLD